MASTIYITANWNTGVLSQQTISRQYDNNRYTVQFVGYPESEDEALDYYLLVWMSSSPGQKPDEIAPILLNSDQWHISNVFTQQVQLIKFQMCVLNGDGTYEAHSPIFTGRIGSSLEHDGTTQDIDVSTLFDAYREYIEELVIGAGAVVIDNTLTQTGQAADAKKTGDEISALKEDLVKDYDSTATYTQGSICRYNGYLYYCKTDIDTAEAFTSSKWARFNSISDLISTLQDAQNINMWWESGDTTIISMSNQQRTALIRSMKKFRVTTYGDSEAEIYVYKINADKSISISFRFTNLRDRTTTHTISLPAVSVYTETTFSGDFFTIEIGYVTAGVESRSIVGSSGSPIKVKTYQVSNPLTDGTILDARLIKKLIIPENVTSFSVYTLFNLNTLPSGYQRKYNAVFNVGYKNGETKSYNFYSADTISGIRTENFDGVSITFDADFLKVYLTAIETSNIALNITHADYNDVERIHGEKYDFGFNLMDYDIAGADFSTIDVRSGTAYMDKSVTYADRKESIALRSAEGSPGSVEVYLPVTPIDAEGVQSFIIPVYTEDADNITYLYFGILKDNETSLTWYRTLNTPFVNGWNYIRFDSIEYASGLETWNNINSYRIVMRSTAQSDIYIGDIITVKPAKAKLIMISDHGYKNFADVALPAFKSRGFPVTFAMKLSLLGQSIEYASRILTEAEVVELAQDPMVDINIHSALPTPSRDQTEDETKEDAWKGLYFLKTHGCYVLPYRVAWWNNNAPHAPETEDMLIMSATYSRKDTRVTAFPWKEPHDVPRYVVHTLSEERVDTIFDQLKKTHGTVLMYTHDISDATVPEGTPRLNMTEAELAYLLSKIDTAVTEGWLEGTTIRGLYTKYSAI